MRKILIWSYHFPPEGGPGVQRISKLIKNIPTREYEVFVLTAQKRIKVYDSTLYEDIENKCKVIKIKDHYSYFNGDVKNWLSAVIVPDKSYFWAMSAYYAAVKLHKEHKFDLIISTSPPHSSHIFANKLALKYNIKLIVEFRDEWTSNSLFEKAKRKDKQKVLEQHVLQSCNKIVTISETAKKNFIAKNISEDKVDVIYNGYDEDDFRNLKLDEKAINNTCLKFGYMGRLNTLHSPRSFFKAMNEVLRGNTNLHFECEIIGEKGNAKWLRDYPELNNHVTFIPYMEHGPCLEKISQADVLLLFSTNSNKTEVITGKVFEYFRLKKPIFAVLSSKKELYGLLKNYNNCYIAYDDDLESTKTQIKRLYEDFANNNFGKIVDNDFIQKFDRKSLSEKYLTIIERLLK